MLSEVLDAIVVPRPQVVTETPHCCARMPATPKEPARQEIEARDYVPQVRPRGEEIEEKDKNPDYKPRRVVVEVCHSWFNRFRKLLVVTKRPIAVTWPW